MIATQGNSTTTRRSGAGSPPLDGSVSDPLAVHALRDPLHPPSAPVTQRKRPQATGATWVDKTSEDVWLTKDRTQKGHLYTVTVGKKETRGALLASITEAGEKQGKNTASYDWVTLEVNYDKVNVEARDPFRVRISGTYGDNDTPLALDFHFGPYNHGYVVKVTDHGKSADIAFRRRLGSGRGATTTFSNQHHDRGDNVLLDDTAHAHGGDTKEKSEQAWDAYTKLAGEGARFQCVKRHATNLTDNTRFFVRQEDDVRWVPFCDLWLSWSGTFDKAFGIPDATVAGKITSDAMKKLDNEKIVLGTGAPSDITARRDYDLTNSRAANEDDTHAWKLKTINIRAKKELNATTTGKVERLLETYRGVVRYAGSKSGKTWQLTLWDDTDEKQLARQMNETAGALPEVEKEVVVDTPEEEGVGSEPVEIRPTLQESSIYRAINKVLGKNSPLKKKVYATFMKNVKQGAYQELAPQHDGYVFTGRGSLSVFLEEAISEVEVPVDPKEVVVEEKSSGQRSEVRKKGDEVEERVEEELGKKGAKKNGSLWQVSILVLVALIAIGLLFR